MDQPLEGERRSVKRVCGDTVGPLELTGATLGLTVSADVRDISIKGIGLVATRRLEAGTALTMKRRGSGHGPSSPLTAEVRQVTEMPDGTWLLGCGFARLLTAEDISGLG